MPINDRSLLHKLEEQSNRCLPPLDRRDNFRSWDFETPHIRCRTMKIERLSNENWARPKFALIPRNEWKPVSTEKLINKDQRRNDPGTIRNGCSRIRRYDQFESERNRRKLNLNGPSWAESTISKMTKWNLDQLLDFARSIRDNLRESSSKEYQLWTQRSEMHPTKSIR